jgi:uncharacterized membrane protein YdbT with pleckstrin-like domain
MAGIHPGEVIRKSLTLVMLRVFLLQLLVVVIYLVIRLPKTYILARLLDEPDYHYLNFWLGIAVFCAIIVIQTALLATIILRWFNEYYVFKENTIVHTKGIFTQRNDIYSLRTIEAASVHQTILGRLLGYGTIRIYSPVLKKEYFLHEIPNPHEMKDVILSLLSGKGEGDKQIIPREFGRNR